MPGVREHTRAVAREASSNGAASPDLMRDMLITFVNALLSAPADAVCGAEYGSSAQP
jgi:hypothetical protein